MAALLTPALRRRFAELGPQDYGDEAKEIVVAHFFLPGTGWDWFAIAYDEDGGDGSQLGLPANCLTENVTQGRPLPHE
jgi:hypothetical protein